VRANQFLVVAPTLHCGFFKPAYDLQVGNRSMGDATFDYEGLIYRWFDRWLKDEENGFAATTPPVQYFAMGENRWRQAQTWPPAGTSTMSFYLDSRHGANSLFGDGKLRLDAPPAKDRPDRFTFDPGIPVPSLGGGICCIGDTIQGGSFDQRPVEARMDVLVYTSEPLERDLDVTGPVRVTLHVSSDAPDTDFTVKLVDVYPDGRAYNLDETVLRARYRQGYHKEVFMEQDRVYELSIGPMSTSNVFLAGHRVRLEVSSSNFPRLARNLNTGGRNFDESEPRVAHNAVHHSTARPSRIELAVLPPRPADSPVPAD